MRATAKLLARTGSFLAASLALVVCLELGSALAQLPGDASKPLVSENSAEQDDSRHDSVFDGTRTSRDDHSSPLTAKQRASLIHANLEKSKRDAVELAQLAKALRAELNGPHANAAAPEVIERAERIEKLAKKIRDETTGY